MELAKLELNDKIFKKLEKNNINSIEKLWNLDRKTLKQLNFSYEEINSIAIKLQLNGLDLNKRKNNIKNIFVYSDALILLEDLLLHDIILILFYLFRKSLV